MMKAERHALAIAVAGSKGGLGKSSIAAALAVRAAKQGRVALVDWEPQGSLSIWWKLRGKPGNPALHVARAGDLLEDVATLKADGVQTIIIDTPPTPMEPIEAAIEAADVVLIPARVGLFDLGGIRPTIGFCQHHKKPMLFVLNAINPDQPGWPKLIKGAAAVCKKYGPVAPKGIRERAAYISALNSGKSGPESTHTAQAKAASLEIDALWEFVQKHSTGKTR